MSVIRDFDYKSHRRFTLRCISKGIVLVSVSLRSSCSKISKGAKEIIQKAEKQLLQDRVKCINATIEHNGNNINNSRSRLSIVTNTTDLNQCSKFIDKVREDRFYKIKDGQVNKFNILISKSNNIRSSHNNQMQASTIGNSNNRNSNNSQLQVETNSKWVINLSKTSLNKGQISILAKGPNFAIAPRHIPNIDYITAIESVCHKLKGEEAGELEADINSLLRRVQVPKPNLTKQEILGLSQLKKDKDRVVCTADKGVAMVVMVKEDYIKKAESLLVQPAYRTIGRDPTIQIKVKLINKLMKIKRNTNRDEGIYKTMYPTDCISPKFYGLPKIHKMGISLRPIVCSRGSVTYGIAKVLTKVLKPLVGKSIHHIQSTSDFVNRAKGVTLQLGECFTSYDVTALFISVPIDSALNIIKDLLEKDQKLRDRKVLSVQNIIKLLWFCLYNTYFSFQNKFYDQVEGVAMGSLASPIVGNLYMEYFERKALQSASHPPRCWFMFVQQKDE